MADIQWIEQVDEGGCGLAVLAMLTGETYARLREHFPVFCNTHGIDHWVMDDYLADMGYAIRRVYKVQHYLEDVRAKWPVKPFAEKHFALVYQTRKDAELGINHSHYVALDARFNVYDPADKEYVKSKLSRYHKVLWIAGVYKVGSALV